MVCEEERKVRPGLGREGWDVVREGFSREWTLRAEKELEGLGRRKQNVQEVLRWEQKW